MADARIPEDFFEMVVPLLPPETPPGAQGGRRAIAHHTVLKVIWFVLVTGCRWKDVPLEMGCCGETAPGATAVSAVLLKTELAA